MASRRRTEAGGRRAALEASGCSSAVGFVAARRAPMARRAFLIASLALLFLGCAQGPEKPGEVQSEVKSELESKNATPIVQTVQGKSAALRSSVTHFQSLSAGCKPDFTRALQIFPRFGSSQSSFAYATLAGQARWIRRPKHDLVALVVEGECLLRSTIVSGDVIERRLGPGSLAHLPAGCPYELEHVGEAKLPSKLLLFFSPQYLGALTEFELIEGAPGAPKGQGSLSLDVIASLDRLERPAGEVNSNLRLSESAGCSVNLSVLDGNLDPHRHMKNDEFLFVLEGEGLLYTQTPDGGVAFHVLRPGSIAHIPEGVAHAFELGKRGTTRLLSIHAPKYDSTTQEAVKWPVGKVPQLEDERGSSE